MKKVFILLDSLFLQNFEIDYKDVFLKHNLNDHYETYILNLNVNSEKLLSVSNFKNLYIVDFSGENLFYYMHENTLDASYFLMPHLILNFPHLALKVSFNQDKIFLNKNYVSQGLDKVLSCIVDKKLKDDLKKEFTESPIFYDSYFGTTLYNSDIMYGTKDFYNSLCKTFKDINKSDVLKLDSHMKFDLALNLTLLRNKYDINSV